MQADPATLPGKADTDGGISSEDYAHLLHRGSGGSMYTSHRHQARSKYERISTRLTPAQITKGETPSGTLEGAESSSDLRA